MGILTINRKEIYLFIAHLSTQGYAASTVTTYLLDPTTGFIVKKMIEGHKRKNSVSKTKEDLFLWSYPSKS